MAYIVNKRDGTVIATVADGTIDTASTSITILGKGFNNYGEIIAENFVQMIEHFAAGVGPDNAIRGQLWFDTTEDRIKVNISNVFNSPTWVTVGAAVVQGTAPTTGFNVGSFWFDTTNDILNISLDGTTFTPLRTTTVGPTEPTGAIEGDLFYDTTTKELKVFNDALHGGGPGFDVVGPARHQATAPTTDLKDGDLWWDSSKKQFYAYDEINNEFRLIGPNSPGGIFSVSGGFTGIVSDSTDGVPLILIKIDDEVLGIWSPRDLANPTSPTVGGCDISSFPNLLRGLNLTTATGPSSEPTLFGGDATGAFYADLAERYAVDSPVEAGDLVSIGGEAEITKTTIEADMNIFGVVSTNPGLKLNSAAGIDQTHPYIALTGRVPVKVIGPVEKGQRLVSSNIPGVAMAIPDNLVSEKFVAVFGRALETDTSTDSLYRNIEAIVGVK